MLTYRQFEKESDYDLMRGILQNNCIKTGYLYPQLHVGNLDFERFSFDESPDMVYENIHFVCCDGSEIGYLDVREDEFYIIMEAGKEELKAEILDYIEKNCYSEETELSTDANSEDLVYTNFLSERGYEKTGGSRFHGICNLAELAPFQGLPEGYRLRTSTLADLSRRAELYVLATGGVKTTEKQYERMMEGPAYQEALDLVVETESGEIIAYCTFWNDPISKIGILEPLACVSEHRRKGITKALLLYGMNELKNMGTQYMYVGTGGKNVASQALYKSVGFKPHGMDYEWQKNPLKVKWHSEEQQVFKGWDFSYIDKRSAEEPLPWSYDQIVRTYIKPEMKLLDMGTGGGEYLLTLQHPYRNTFITEAYPPNVELCKKTLTPMGITVEQVFDDEKLPFENEQMDIIINRHEAYDVKEVKRILKPGGLFITQQVGGLNNKEMSKYLLGAFEEIVSSDHDLEKNRELLQKEGFEILKAQEYFPYLRFFDVGALVYFAKIIEWEFPDFSVEKCFEPLLELNKVQKKQGFIDSKEHRFILVAKNSIV